MRKFILLFAGLAFVCQAACAQIATPEPKNAPDARVKKLLEARKIDYEITESGNFKVAFVLKSGRRQVALIQSDTYRSLNAEVREILSPAYRSPAPFSAEIANRLLEDNNDRKFGGWVMQKGKDGCYAMFVVKVPADSGEESFFNALLLTLTAADEMEKELTGKDEF